MNFDIQFSGSATTSTNNSASAAEMTTVILWPLLPLPRGPLLKSRGFAEVNRRRYFRSCLSENRRRHGCRVHGIRGFWRPARRLELIWLFLRKAFFTSTSLPLSLCFEVRNSSFKADSFSQVMKQKPFLLSCWIKNHNKIMNEQFLLERPLP